MKNSKYVLKLFIITSCLLMVMIIGAFWYLNNTIASNRVLNEYLSPDNKFKVVVFERDAGVTTGFSTQVSIIPAKSSLSNEGGNIFIADTDHEKDPSGKGGGPEVRVLWVGNDRIIISYHKNTRIFEHENKFKNIIIEYQQFNKVRVNYCFYCIIF